MNLHGMGRRRYLTVAAAALLISLTACGTAGDEPMVSSAPTTTTTATPTPSADAAAPTDAAPDDAASDDAAPTVQPLAASTPVSISIPTLGRTSDLIETGMRADNTLEVPPGAEGSPASWYDGSPTPGETGSAIILGHVNSLSDESGVFFELDTLVAGDEISVTRADGSTAVFEVYRLESFAKSEFPTRDVYFPTPAPELRLITCDDLGAGGDEFPNNTVVYASLVGQA